MARDIRNVTRGCCNNCRSCTNYISLSGKVLCDYCGCPPAKHEHLEEQPSGRTVEEESVLTRSKTDPEALQRDEGKGGWSRVPFAHRGRVVYNTRLFVRSGSRSSSGSGNGREQRVRSRTPEPQSPKEVDLKRRSASFKTAVPRSSLGSRLRRPADSEASVAKTSRKLRCAASPTSKMTSSPNRLRCSGRRSAVPKVTETPTFEKRMSSRLSHVLDMPPPNTEIQEMNAWNPEDRSYNIFVKEDDFSTLHRHPVAQSTDAIRSKIGYESGLTVFEFTWPSRERGTHAMVGVCTADAPVHCVGYQGLVGNSEHSWGWDLGRLKACHDSKNLPGESYPEGVKPEHGFTVPDKFSLVIDMDEGVVGFIVRGQYLGHAFKGLRGKKLYVTVSAVWGHCEISMKYLGGLESGPVALTHLCRRVIRQTLTCEAIASGKIDDLTLPKTIRDFLAFREPYFKDPTVVH